LGLLKLDLIKNIYFYAMKSVFHIRIDSAPGYRSDAIQKGFIANGFEYHGFDWQAYRMSNGVEKLREEVVRLAAEIKPTIIFAHIQNPEILDLYTWSELQKIAFVINYTFDVRVSHEMAWMYRVAKEVGYTFFACDEDVTNCVVSGIDNVNSIHSSCDMDLYKSQGRDRYAFDVVFCGNRYDNTNLNFPLSCERQWMIDYLQKDYAGRFMAYGLGQKGGLIPPEVEVNVYNFSKIAINQNNFYLHSYTSDRLWRIMASGCFCLTKYFPGIEHEFEKGIHLDWWFDYDDLTRLIDKYLEDESARKFMAKTGMDYVRSNHNWTKRIEKMLQLANQ